MPPHSPLLLSSFSIRTCTVFKMSFSFVCRASVWLCKLLFSLDGRCCCSPKRKHTRSTLFAIFSRRIGRRSSLASRAHKLKEFSDFSKFRLRTVCCFVDTLSSHSIVRYLGRNYGKMKGESLDLRESDIFRSRSEG